MARARNLKPGFFTNELLAECPPLARLLFQGMWCHADREGRLENRPRKLKAEILPYDDCDVPELLRALESRGFTRLYTAGNCQYIQIVNFTKHQNPHPKEPQSEIPAEESREKKFLSAESREKTFTAGPLPSSLSPLSDPIGSSAGAPVEPKAWVFGELLGWLMTTTGRKEPALRSWLGKCCKQFGENAVMAAGMLVRAPPTPVDPISAMMDRLNRQVGNGKRNGTAAHPKLAPGDSTFAGFAIAIDSIERAEEGRAPRDSGASGDAAKPLLDPGG